MRSITELSNDELFNLGNKDLFKLKGIGEPSTYSPFTVGSSIGSKTISEDEEANQNLKKYIGSAEQYITGNKILKLNSNDLDAALWDAGWSQQDIDRYYVKIGLR